MKPRKRVRKEHVISFRVTDAQRTQWMEEAEKLGITLAQYVTYRCNGLALIKVA